MAQRKLLRFYNSVTRETKDYSNGIRLRFFKPYMEAVNSREKAKINALRNRQSEFLNMIQTRSSLDIVQIDHAAEDEPTLRQMIMNIKSKDNNKIPLFHSVDLDWRQEGYTFQYAPNLKEEAECTIFTLLPLLKTG